jgi:hypothetical protein
MAYSPTTTDAIDSGDWLDDAAVEDIDTALDDGHLPEWGDCLRIVAELKQRRREERAS